MPICGSSHFVRANTNGRVALYGIFFDFNKADVKPESAEALTEVQALLKVDPELKLLVVGHTDNADGFESNKSLSENRGISSQRLFPSGCGFASPAAANTSDERRAKNRRIELVRW